ncbi:MAG: biopolymer transporter ExbD [Candidatus Latescibacterota bacterium]
MASAASEEEDLITAINVTPLVDVCLVLLIIMMVTAISIVTRSFAVEDVDIPEAQNPGHSGPSKANIAISKDGKIYLNAKQMEEAEFVDAVADAYALNSQLEAIVSADKSTLHGMVVHVLDLVKGVGVTRFAISVEEIKEGS